jgi:hypothetical protein
MSDLPRRAAELLGPDHPIARAADATEAVRRQVVVCAVFAVTLTIFAWPQLQRSLPLTASAAVVELALLALLMLLRHERTSRIHQLIAAAGPALPLLAEVQEEARQLCDPRTRQALAKVLLRTLDSAERWAELPPAQRPPPNVRALAPHAALVRRAASLLVEGQPSARGVAIVEQLVTDGYQSPLYCGDGERLRRELGRIVFELESAGTKRL